MSKCIDNRVEGMCTTSKSILQQKSNISNNDWIREVFYFEDENVKIMEF